MTNGSDVYTWVQCTHCKHIHRINLTAEFEAVLELEKDEEEKEPRSLDVRPED